MSQGPAGKKVIRLVVRVLISGPSGAESVRAKVDTGADRTTVSRELAKRLGLSPTGSNVTVKVSAGSQRVQRPLVEATIALKGKSFKLKVGVADRSLMRYGVIIGRDILRSGDFLIDPSRKSLSPPGP